MSSPYTPTETEIQTRMTAQMPHLTHAEARWSLIRAHLQTQQAAPAARSISPADFIQRIPAATWAKISAARQGTSALAVSLDQGITQLCASTVVVEDNAQLLSVLAALVTFNVITEAEKTQILGF